MKFGRNKQQKSKIRLYFGYGLMIFVGFSANCLVLLMENSYWKTQIFRNLTSCFVTFSLYGLVSYSLTSTESETDKFELVPQQFELVDGAIFMIYSASILALVNSGAQESENFETFYKIWFSMLILWGVHGIRQASNGTVIMTEDTVPWPTKTQATVATHTTIQIETLITSRPECKICFREYTETSRAPRILEKCYHTACEPCLNRLLAENDYKYVQCPFCQMVTGVNGPARQLPKNYAVLDTIQG